MSPTTRATPISATAPCKDNVTCLVWEKANPATQGTWQASADRCAALATSNYAGFNDWRMPTRVEMASITDVNNGAKGFASIFTVTSGYYGTSSWWYETITGQNTSGFQFGYGTNGFTSNAVAMSGTNNVARCVRGNGAGEAADAFAKEPPNHYTDRQRRGHRQLHRPRPGNRRTRPR